MWNKKINWFSCKKKKSLNDCQRQVKSFVNSQNDKAGNQLRNTKFNNSKYTYPLHYWLQILTVTIVALLVPTVLPETFNQYPQGYYPFAESPAKIPPKVRKPPYLQTQVNCPGKMTFLSHTILALQNEFRMCSELTDT